MKTKDSIIDEALMRIKTTDGTNEIGDYMSAAMDEWAGYVISQKESITTTYDIPKHILDAFARQRAIEFDAWKFQNRWAIDVANVHVGYIRSTWDEASGGFKYEKVAPEQLYNQFIETKNKQG